MHLARLARCFPCFLATTAAHMHVAAPCYHSTGAHLAPRMHDPTVDLTAPTVDPTLTHRDLASNMVAEEREKERVVG